MWVGVRRAGRLINAVTIARSGAEEEDDVRCVTLSGRGRRGGKKKLPPNPERGCPGITCSCELPTSSRAFKPQQNMQPASAKWYDRRDSVFVEFCVEDSKDVEINFEKEKFTFSCLGGAENVKHFNEVNLYNAIDPNLNWLKVDFNNWNDWEDDPEEEDLSSFEKFSQMMNNMGGDDDGDIPDVDGMDDDGSQDSDDEKMPDLE
uniref:prostaglandin E synthase 3-like isoform X2 n=1 Tax=Pristiophorus japonicus TaxID=55135 RepID=UPI00398F3FD0